MKQLLYIISVLLLFSFPIKSGNGRTFHGEKFVFESIEKRGDEFVKQISSFEAKIIDEANYTSDILLKSGKRMEYKSWKKGSFEKLMKGEQFKNQLKAYLKSWEEGAGFEYVIDRNKLLKDGVLDPDKFVKGEFQKVFKENAKELFEQNQSFFRQFKGIDGKTIDNLPAFEKLVKDESFVKQLSNFIKVE